jgi:site-specific recombinase XerD
MRSPVRNGLAPPEHASFATLHQSLRLCKPGGRDCSFARMIERDAAAAGLELKTHPQLLRHACGYALANKGHDTRAIQGWLGHRSITSTAVYTALAPNRFRDFWRE